MTISSLSSNTYMNYTSIRTTGAYASGAGSISTSQTEETVQAGGRAGGPPPPPPGGGKDGGQGPQALDLDTDGDDMWSAEEMSTFASEAGIEIDTDSILETYDTDGDGLISSDEEVSMRENNAFGLPSPQDMMNQMRGFGPPPNIQQAESSDDSSDSSLDLSSAEEIQQTLMQQLLDAYNAQNEEVYSDIYESTYTFTV